MIGTGDSFGTQGGTVRLKTHGSTVLILLTLSTACGAGGSTAPATPAGPFQPTMVTFSDLTSEGVAVASYDESGVRILPRSGSWQAGANYGNPRPFIRFRAEAGTTTVGELQVTAGGALFSFQSIDLYASTTPIPYVITGLRASSSRPTDLRGATPVFTMTGTVPNTFGNFRTVSNPSATAQIDILKITLTNPAAPCCGNPMGVDNIALGK
ncbi:MAG TPA: hypothetical protein VNJ04_05815 [Gemmatimonadaceae bacterium]|nr:hypothetical protein [Gemmatimonadaceae bacterium]